MLKDMAPEDKAKYYTLEARLAKRYGDVETAVFEEIKNKVRTKFKSSVKGETSHFKGVNIDYEGCIKVIDVFTNERIVFDTEKSSATGFDVNAFEEWLREQRAEVAKEIRRRTIRGVVDYDPYNAVTLQTTEILGKEANKVNSHQFPEWRRKEIKSPKLPQEFKDLIEHLFPNKDCRRYILFWMKNAIVQRNYTHLLLNSPRGTGKGTFMEIMNMLVGESNFKTVDPEFWESRFNYELKNRRIWFFDEHAITKKNINQLKAYGNERISIEGKGQNITGDVHNYASAVISNNGAGQNYLASDERRFSVPTITKQTLVKRFGIDWIHSTVTKARNDLDFISNIGWWVMGHIDDEGFDNQQPYKTETFWDLVEESLTPWQLRLVQKLEDKEMGKELVEDISGVLEVNHDLGRQKLSRFLDEHTDRDGDRYASVILKGNKRWLVPSEKYKIEVNTKDDEDIDDMFENEEW